MLLKASGRRSAGRGRLPPRANKHSGAPSVAPICHCSSPSVPAGTLPGCPAGSGFRLGVVSGWEWFPAGSGFRLEVVSGWHTRPVTRPVTRSPSPAPTWSPTGDHWLTAGMCRIQEIMNNAQESCDSQHPPAMLLNVSGRRSAGRAALGSRANPCGDTCDLRPKYTPGLPQGTTG